MCRSFRWGSRSNPPSPMLVAALVSATPMQVALAWLLHRTPNILLIPGRSSVKHLGENFRAATRTAFAETTASATLSEFDGRRAVQGTKITYLVAAAFEPVAPAR
jgi:diketogulonate reductase-like aldo/keto reductase